MNAFNGKQLEAMVKYMEAFINLARLCPEIEQTDLEALDRLNSYIETDTSLAPEVSDGYRAVYDRVHGMIFGTNMPQLPYKVHRVNHPESKILARNRELDTLVFDTYEDATKFYEELLSRILKYGSVTVEDVLTRYGELYGPSGYTPTYFDSRSGWTSLPYRHNYIIKNGCLWRLALPRPEYISFSWRGDNENTRNG